MRNNTQQSLPSVGHSTFHVCANIPLSLPLHNIPPLHLILLQSHPLLASAEM